MMILTILNSLAIFMLLYMVLKVIKENIKLKKSLNALIENTNFQNKSKEEDKLSYKPLNSNNYLRQATYEAYKRNNQDYMIGGDN